MLRVVSELFVVCGRNCGSWDPWVDRRPYAHVTLSKGLSSWSVAEKETPHSAACAGCGSGQSLTPSPPRLLSTSITRPARRAPPASVNYNQYCGTELRTGPDLRSPIV